MARKARVIIPNMPHHIVQRGYVDEVEERAGIRVEYRGQGRPVRFREDVN